MMKPRSDRLERLKIPREIADPLRRRIKPLERMYWLRQGAMSVNDALLFAYLQGMKDTQEFLEKNNETE